MALSVVFENKDFFNWTVSVLVLRDTMHALHPFVKETTKLHLDKKWSRNERLHLKQFKTHNYPLSYGTVEQLYKLKCNCSDCTAIYKILAGMKTFPDMPLQLGEPSSFSSDDWWILLKMFLPKRCCNTESLEKCDVASLCDLLQRCQLFDEVCEDIFKQIKSCRNKLMHSSSFEISEKQKKQYFEDLISMCSHPLLCHRIEIQNCLTKLKHDRDYPHQFDSPIQEFKTVRDAFEIQENAIKQDLKECKDLKQCQFNRSDLEKLIEQVKGNKSTAIDVLNIKNKLVVNLAEATALGIHEGEMQLSGYAGRAVGRLTGGAGAFVAGNCKIMFDNNDK